MAARFCPWCTFPRYSFSSPSRGAALIFRCITAECWFTAMRIVSTASISCVIVINHFGGRASIRECIRGTIVASFYYWTVSNRFEISIQPWTTDYYCCNMAAIIFYVKPKCIFIILPSSLDYYRWISIIILYMEGCIFFVYLRIEIWGSPACKNSNRERYHIARISDSCPTFVICDSSVVTVRNKRAKFPRKFFSRNNLV